MNRNYTLEDVEALRAKTGISYEEAVALLDKYDGDMARALIELEKRGVINPRNKAKAAGKESFAAWLQRVWVLGMRTRVHIEKSDQTLVNLSVIYMIAFLIVAFPLALVSIALVFIMGCRISLIRNSDLYGSAEIQTMVKNAAENIKSSVQSFTSPHMAEEKAASNEPDAPPRSEPESPWQPAPPADPEPESTIEDDDFPSITIE